MHLIAIKLAILTVFASLQLQHVSTAVVEPIVTISQGKLKGVIGEARGGRNYVEYLGIPYVKKPERFQEGTPAQPWEGLKDGTKFGSVCPQWDRKSKTVIGTEDCLFLNVYTPEIPKSSASPTGTKTSSPTWTNTGSSTWTKEGPSTSIMTKRPVIVFIHGGSFVAQSSDLFGPKYLLDEDVILVTFNYRLSVFGFLSTGDKETVSNLALRDQIQALKWVHQNIQAFGGDPTRVTLFGGGSAGGAMASYLTLSPLAKGLFSNVISSSGNALCPWAIVRNPRKVAEKLAAKLNCPNTKTTKEIVSCLKGKSVKDIEIARVSLQGFNEDPAVPFAPVVESWLAKDLTASAVVPDSPEKLMTEGKFMRVPWLTGVNSLNGVNLGVANLVTNPKRLSQIDQDWAKFAPKIFHFSQTAPNPANVSEEIREHFFGTKKISFETKDRFIAAMTDRNYNHCAAKAATLQSKFTQVYLYYLNYIGAASFLDDWGLREKLADLKGVVHGDELQHLFNLKLGSFPLLKKGDKHYLFSEKMVKLWVAFAKNGKPMESTDKAGSEWSAVIPNRSKEVVQWYNLVSPTSLSQTIVLDDNKQSIFWDFLDLGESLSPKDVPKFAVGYENLKTTSKPSPITPTQSAKPIKSAGKPGTSSDALTPLKPQPTPSSGLKTYTSNLDIPSYKPTPEKTMAGKPGSVPTGSLTSPGLVSQVSQKLTPVPIVVTPKPSKINANDPPVAISAVFKDDDPYSSTTTTTTKKPGFFSKILG